MSNQTVPDGMILIDGKLEKKAKLELRHHFQNFLFNYLTYGYFWKSIVWYWRGALIRWQKCKELLSFPVVVELFGDDPTACINVLRSYGVYACEGSVKWAVMQNKVNLRLLILVSKSQYEFTDNILAQTSCVAYQLTDMPGPKRGQTLPRPFVQRSVQPAKQTARTAKLGSSRLGR